ncbi:hypothetical protein BD770DRAFT_392880 [Pilaira anomala]|nr:hypothetical protein BD770DRAFT_392880 [Pilaira anomala]
MLSSYVQPDMSLELDDEEGDRNELSSIDTAHHFLNFSRKVTEASSMRKPVDIQLGISCGKDIVFGFPSRVVRRSSPPPPQEHRSPLSKKENVHDVMGSSSSRKPSQKKYTGINPPTTTHSSLLDQLVADVLNHIESCPEQSAYSDDLDRLKPFLNNY